MMFEASGGPRLGVVDGDKVIDVAAADPALPKTMLALIKAGPEALARVAAAVKGAGAGAVLALKDVKPALPIERPGKFI
ncbi:MAG: 5-carboxymethyl-2-hydroxymuconate isomerase, partial [Hoeflea sp.]